MHGILSGSHILSVSINFSGLVCETCSSLLHWMLMGSEKVSNFIYGNTVTSPDT